MRRPHTIETIRSTFLDGIACCVVAHVRSVCTAGRPKGRERGRAGLGLPIVPTVVFGNSRVPEPEQGLTVAARSTFGQKMLCSETTALMESSSARGHGEFFLSEGTRRLGRTVSARENAHFGRNCTTEFAHAAVGHACRRSKVASEWGQNGVPRARTGAAEATAHECAPARTGS